MNMLKNILKVNVSLTNEKLIYKERKQTIPSSDFIMIVKAFLYLQKTRNPICFNEF